MLHRVLNEKMTEGVFPNNLKLADVTPVFKKGDGFDRKTTDLSAFSRLYLIFMKNGCKGK